MTNEHTAALERALDSVRNALGILSSLGGPWSEGIPAWEDLLAAEKRLSAAIGKEPAK